MATASPTPMNSHHFASLSRRPSSRQTYKPFPTRPPLHRSDSVPASAHARTYSLNDSSDDEIAIPVMKFSAATNALLNDAALTGDTPSARSKKNTPEVKGTFRFRAGSQEPGQEKGSPLVARVHHSPYPRRVVRLSGGSGTPSTLRRSVSVSSAVKRRNERSAEKLESPLNLSTPAPELRTIPKPNSGVRERDFGSSIRTAEADSPPREEEQDLEAEEYPSTVAKPNFATSQGSVSRYAPSTIGRTRYGEDPALQGSMRINRVAKVTGTFLRGPARRGRRRISDEERSPVDENGQGLDSGPSSQEPESQESQAPESQSPDLASQGSNLGRGAYYSSNYRDFASGSPVGSKDALNSMLRSNSPPPPTLSSPKRPSTAKPPSQAQPVFKVPAPRPDLPSTHDQENEAPPTFKRNNKQPLIHIDASAKPMRPQSMDMEAVVASRPPLALRSQNTPRRPAPPPPKMSILEAATTTAGPSASQSNSRKNKMKVNGKIFTRLDCIGRGGSSRVYRVMAENSKFFALKKVNLDDADENAVIGFKGEIDLLTKLKEVDRVIRLYDYELNEDKGSLSVVSTLHLMLVILAHCV